MNANYLINELLNYAIEKDILDKENYDYCANVLIDYFKLKEFSFNKTLKRNLEDILEDLTSYALQNKLLEDNDIVSIDNFKAKIIDVIIDKPSTVTQKFNSLYQKRPSLATEYLYKLSKDTNYIQSKRIAQNKHWVVSTEYGQIELTINLSKPEKDPKLIALQRLQNQGYPKCQLCKQNQGYRGHIGYDSRANMRIIPLLLNGENWYFQYSPYSYFNEHSIVLNEEHIPMVINGNTFKKLLDFLDYFPDYFVGSNAGLPIVGGSILNHEHYQSGRCEFPIEKAKGELIKTVDEVEIYQVVWPLSTIRIKSENKEKLIETALNVLDKWQNYENQGLLIINSKDDIHNTITPISRKEQKKYVFDLILRSNYTNHQYPDGVFHPHPNLYHIKKENIGLIEAMGLGVLPPRLKKEFELIAQTLAGDQNAEQEECLAKHQDWIKDMKKRYSKDIDLERFILSEAGEIFSLVLKDAGVFKMDVASQNAFRMFIQSIYA